MALGRVFISYRLLDSVIAQALANCIDAAGGSVYLDERDPQLDGIRVGSPPSERPPVMETIVRGLQESDMLLAVITRRTRGSWWVPAEVSAALQMQKQVVLVCEQDVRPPDFTVSAVISNLQALRDWLGSHGGPVVNSSDLALVERELFSARSDAIRRASRASLDSIEALWEEAIWRDLRLESERYAFAGKWMGCRTATLIGTLYAIAAPVYMYKRASPRLDRSELEREVAAILYEAWTDEESLARIAPQIVYEARKCTEWRTLREEDPRRYWLQGMKPRDLDALFDEMTTTDGALISADAFHDLYVTRYRQSGSFQKPLGLAANPLQGFTLNTRPVYARVLAVHALVHHALLRLDDVGGVATLSLQRLFELPAQSHLYNSEAAQVGYTYLMRKYAERLRGLGAQDTATASVG